MNTEISQASIHSNDLNWGSLRRELEIENKPPLLVSKVSDLKGIDINNTNYDLMFKDDELVERINNWNKTQDLDNILKYLDYLEYPAARTGIDGFNHFIRHGIAEQLEARNVSDKSSNGETYYYGFHSPVVSRPYHTRGGKSYKLYPNAARNYHITYQFSVYALLSKYTINENGEKIYWDTSANRIHVMSMPAMVGSCVCHLEKIHDPIKLMTIGEDPKDARGYFIINGSKKFFIMTDKLRMNRIFIFPPSNFDKTTRCRITVPVSYGSKMMQVILDPIHGSALLQMASFGLDSSKRNQAINVIAVADVIDHYFNFRDGVNGVAYMLSEEERNSGRSQLPGILPIFRMLMKEYSPSEHWPQILAEFLPTETTYTVMSSVNFSNKFASFAAEVDTKLRERQAQTIAVFNDKKDDLRLYWETIYNNEHDQQRKQYIFNDYQIADAKLTAEYTTATNEITEMINQNQMESSKYAHSEHRVIGIVAYIMDGLGKDNIAEWKEILNDIFIKNFFPNISPNDMIAKIKMLAIMTVELILHKLGLRGIDDKNNWSNKKIDTPGSELIKVIRAGLKGMFDEAKIDSKGQTLDNSVMSVSSKLSVDIINREISNAFNSPNYGAEGGFSRKALTDKGETSVARQLTQLTKIDTKSDRNSTSMASRSVHPSQKAWVSAEQVTDDEACGLVKNLANTARITVYSDPSPVFLYLNRNGLIVQFKDINHPDYILINCIPYGWTNARLAYNKMFEARRKGEIDEDAEFVVKGNGRIEIFTDASRLVRPLYYVDPSGLVGIDLDTESKDLSFAEMLSKGLVGYLGVAEAEYINIAYDRDILNSRLLNIDQSRENLIKQENGLATGLATQQDVDLAKTQLYKVMEPYHYMELHPTAIFSIAGSHIPNIGNMHSCRAALQTKMFGQAIGTIGGNPNIHEGVVRKLLYPSKPIMGTGFDKIYGFDRGIGTNVDTLLACYSGYNQEDSIAVSQQAVDNGLFRYVKYIVRDARLDEINGAIQYFGKPNIIPGEEYRYRNINDNGLPSIGVYANEDDCIIGKINDVNGIKSDHSIFMGVGEYGIVDSVKELIDDKGKYITVRIRSTRKAEVGTKYAFQEGAQKAVIGAIIPTTDMPYRQDGSIPSVIMNPLSIPSRMTISLLMEMLFGISASMAGKFIDGTGFRKHDTKSFSKVLKMCGMNEYNEAVFYNGVTGEPIKSSLFSGVAYLKNLHHVARDKIQYRGRGSVSVVNRQPFKGKKYKGACRFSEMDLRALLEYGAVNIIKGRLCKHSDAFNTVYCKRCGIFARCESYMDEKDTRVHKVRFFCKVCNGADFGTITIPYILKLIIQQLASVGLLIYSKLAYKEDWLKTLEEMAIKGNYRLGGMEDIDIDDEDDVDDEADFEEE